MDQSRLYSLYESDPEPILAFLEHLRDEYGLAEPTRILDMGCGPGRMLKPLSEAGWVVTAHEPDVDYAAAAMEAAEALPDVHFERSGLLDLDASEAFEMVALINGPLSYVLDPAARREALARCRDALVPGGVLLIDVANSSWVLKNYREPPRMELDIDGTRVVRTASHELDFHTGRLVHHDRFEWADAEGAAESVVRTHTMAMIGFPEIDYFLRDLGFVDVATFNAYEDREPSQLEGRKILVSARRAI